MAKAKIKRPAIPKKIREAVHLKYNGHCAYCGKDIAYKEMQVDHAFPLHYADYYKKNFGVDCHDIANLEPACRSCNHYKREMTVKEFRKLMSTLHHRIQKQYIDKVAIDYGIITLKPFDGKFYFEKHNRE